MDRDRPNNNRHEALAEKHMEQQRHQIMYMFFSRQELHLNWTRPTAPKTLHTTKTNLNLSFKMIAKSTQAVLYSQTKIEAIPAQHLLHDWAECALRMWLKPQCLKTLLKLITNFGQRCAFPWGNQTITSWIHASSSHMHIISNKFI